MEPPVDDSTASYINYKRVVQMSQSTIASDDSDSTAENNPPPKRRDNAPANDIVRKKTIYSPLKWYYTQLAWGKLCSFIQPMIGSNFSGTEVYPGLWVSDHASVCDLQALQDRNITHVVCAFLGVEPLFPKYIQYTTLPMRDTSDEDIYQYFDQVADLIHATLEPPVPRQSRPSSILVHCRCGVSRSVALVCAYLIRYKYMSHMEAIRTVQAKRSCANPIAAFRHQLRSYEQRYLDRPRTTNGD